MERQTANQHENYDDDTKHGGEVEHTRKAYQGNLAQSQGTREDSLRKQHLSSDLGGNSG